MAGTPDVTDIGNGKTKALNKNDYLNMYINIRANQTFNNLVFKPKLEKGNKATPYSPYGMGSINEKIQTRNVVPNNAISQIKNGVELIKNEDGSFILNGTASANFDITFATNFTLKAGVYTSSIKQQIKRGLYYSFDNIADTMLNGNSGKRKTTFTLNADKTYSRAFLWIDNGTTFNNETYFIQTEPGSTESSYVPHEEQDYSIFVQQPFRSIGDVRDCFVKKSDGWYERHYIGEYIANNDLPGNGMTDTLIGLLTPILNIAPGLTGINFTSIVRSNLLQNTIINNSGLGGTNGDSRIRVNLSKDFAKTFDEANAFLTNNKFKIEFVQKEPLDLPCTETQIQQIENKPSTYKDFTYVVSEDETPAHLKIQYWKEVE